MIDLRNQEQLIRALQIVTVAMVAGLIVFLAVASIMQHQMAEPAPVLKKMLLFVFGVLALGGAVGYSIFRVALVAGLKKKLVKTSDVEMRKELCLSIFSSKTIIRSAVCEGWGLFSIVFFLLTGNTIGVVGALLAIVLLLAGIPTQYNYDDFESRLDQECPCHDLFSPGES